MDEGREGEKERQEEMKGREGEKEEGRKGKRGGNVLSCLAAPVGDLINAHDIRCCEPVSQCRNRGVGSALAHHRFTH